MSTTMERRYQMTRIEPGDYLLPDNEAKTLWRISRYREDGSLESHDGSIVRGTFWKIARFDGSRERADALIQRDLDEFLGWSHWIEWEALIPTRAEAIDSALKAAAAMLEP